MAMGQLSHCVEAYGHRRERHLHGGKPCVVLRCVIELAVTLYGRCLYKEALASWQLKFEHGNGELLCLSVGVRLFWDPRLSPTRCARDG